MKNERGKTEIMCIHMCSCMCDSLKSTVCILRKWYLFCKEVYVIGKIYVSQELKIYLRFLNGLIIHSQNSKCAHLPNEAEDPTNNNVNGNIQFHWG